MPTQTRFILASASPARLRTLRAAGVEAEVVVSGVDESTVGTTDPVVACVTLARQKAEAVAARIQRRGTGGKTLVLGCDSLLEFGGAILGKPRDATEATARWRALRGRHGVLHTGHCLIDLTSGQRAEGVGSTTVHFGAVADAEIAAYVATGEPLEVAGAFTIDGLGGWFVDGVSGDPGTVIGVSLPLLRRLLAELGTSVAQLWPG